jgi:hypothetical protein
MVGLVFCRRTSSSSVRLTMSSLLGKMGAFEVASGVRGKVSTESDEFRDEDALGVDEDEEEDEP